MMRLMNGSTLSLITLFFLLPFISSCTTLIGAGATVGVAAVQERGIKGRAKDLQIEALILEKFIKAGIKLTATIGVEVYEGRVLLTGASKNTKITDQAVRIAWKVNDVKDVINEIQVGRNSTISNIAQDSLITTQIKSNLTFDQNVYSINYTIETVNGTVYLIGIAQNRAEHERVKQHAEKTKFVRNVISHVRIKK
ncbi:MAG: BON domain-containing protein [Pseudomonadota bacterium]|nr:BON domain-containing protein [Pseudomonadota bacterium]